MAEDMVNHPPHYTQGEIECIDALKAALGEEGFRGYLRGCAIKYLWRGPYKGVEKQDYEKALWYLNRLLEETPEAKERGYFVREDFQERVDAKCVGHITHLGKIADNMKNACSAPAVTVRGDKLWLLCSRCAYQWDARQRKGQ